MVELRRYERAPIDIAVEVAPKGADDRSAGRAKDISLGGMFVEMSRPLPFGSELVVYITLPGQKSRFALPCVVRWTSARGMGVQFGLIGARETYAITQITKPG